MRQRVTHPALRLILEATGAAMAVHQNKIDEASRAAEASGRPTAPKQAVDFAAFAAGLAMPVAGRGDSFEPIAARCRAEQKATDGMIRWMIRYGDILALTHTGELDLADQRVADYSRFSSQGQFVGWAIARIMAGVVATYRGKFRRPSRHSSRRWPRSTPSTRCRGGSRPVAAGPGVCRIGPNRRS